MKSDFEELKKRISSHVWHLVTALAEHAPMDRTHVIDGEMPDGKRVVLVVTSDPETCLRLAEIGRKSTASKKALDE